MRRPNLAIVPILALAGCHSVASEEIPDGAIVCSQNAGQIDASAAPSEGLYELCTPDYPTCTPPYPEAPGYQCCLDTYFDSGGGSIMCMPRGN